MTIFNQNQLDQLAELLIASSSEIALACQNAECDVQKEIGKLGGAINMGKEFPNEPMAEIFEFIKAKDEYINWVIDKFINYYQSEESPLDLLEKCRKALSSFSEGDSILILSAFFGIMEEVGNSCLTISEEQKNVTSNIFVHLYDMNSDLAEKIAFKWRETKLKNFM
tara:strand:- start:77 stop:577 length:501 start_codon:yes stop_codon:yes gene_type:complete